MYFKLIKMDYPIKSKHNLLKILIGKRSEIYYFLYEYSKNEAKITNMQNYDNLLFQSEINMFLSHLN